MTPAQLELQQAYLNQGLSDAAERHGLTVSEQVDLIRARPSTPVVPHTPPELPWPPLGKVLVAAAKPVLKLSVLASGVYVVVVSAAAVGAAVMAFVAENAMVIGGGVLVLAALIGGVGSLFASGVGEASQSGRTSHTGQNINVTVNVGGHDVNTK